MTLRAAALLLSVSLGAGCALGPQRAAKPDIELAVPPDGYAAVYLSRPAHLYSSEVWPDVYLDQQQVVGLKNGSYTYFFLLPGDYTVRTRKAQWYSGAWDERIEISPRAGETLFLSLRVLRDGRAWSLLEPAQGRAELRDQTYLAPSRERW